AGVGGFRDHRIDGWPGRIARIADAQLVPHLEELAVRHENRGPFLVEDDFKVLVRQVDQPFPVGRSREHLDRLSRTFPVWRLFLRVRDADCCGGAEEENSDEPKRENWTGRISFEGSMRHRERRPRGRPRLQSPETWERFADYAVLKNQTK